MTQLEIPHPGDSHRDTKLGKDVRNFLQELTEFEDALGWFEQLTQEHRVKREENHEVLNFISSMATVSSLQRQWAGTELHLYSSSCYFINGAP